MAIPNKTAPYPHLAKAVALPAPKAVKPGRMRKAGGAGGGG
jgi:hypothetical protein